MGEHGIPVPYTSTEVATVEPRLWFNDGGGDDEGASIAMMSGAIAEENTRDGSKIQFVAVVSTKVRIALAAKDSVKRRNRVYAEEGAQKERLGQKGEAGFNHMAVTAFNNTVLFTRMWTRETMLNAHRRQKGSKLAKFTSTISLNRFKFCFKLTFSHDIEPRKCIKNV
ncbi:hypothetical protein E3N88_06677 [Mikania micrantha]|uniref:Uncharacterized protein n=1 Tax=Mikania micrantha TaxID=192012 RepID=A0A5N6PQ51_9ASTR|nr:hypothetical protein E3N88_06677 [Mikania micrantha]